MAIDSVWDTRWTLNVFSTNLFRDSNGRRYTTDQHEYTDLMSEVVNLSPNTCIDTVLVSISLILIFLSACSDCFFFLFLSMKIVVVVVLYFAMWSLSLFHMFVFRSCRMSTLTHSFRVCYLLFAICIDLTRDTTVPRRERAANAADFHLCQASRPMLIWMSNLVVVQRACSFTCVSLFNQEPGKVAASHSNHVSYGFYEKYTKLKLHCAVRSLLKLLSVEKSQSSSEKRAAERAGGGKMFHNKFPQERPTTTINSSSPVFGLWSINSNS